MDKFYISKEYLDKAEENASRALVGKVMKRFEVLDDEKARKKAIKELIYEGFRDFKVVIKAFSYGVKFIIAPKTGKKDNV